tara:strand:- start:3533 stop:4801 length:1269 start_codon:yes stop_codon:yes gene_type:complete
MRFCTYFDFNYIDRAKVLFDSVEQNCDQFKIYCLCLDQQSFNEIKGNYGESYIAISLHELEIFEPKLLDVKKDRSNKEYIFTLSPVILLFVLNKYNIKEFTYIDADTYFLETPKVVIEECGNNDILITPHFFPDSLKHLEVHGVYNFGLMHIKDTENALKALEWWKNKCLEWCYDKVEEDRAADQKYLDKFPKLFKGIAVSKKLGINAGPWMLNGINHRIKNNKIYFNNDLLIHYHFHNIQKIKGDEFKIGLSSYNVKLNKVILKLYIHYFTIYNKVNYNHTKTKPYISSNIEECINLNNKDIISNTFIWENLTIDYCLKNKIIYEPIRFIDKKKRKIVIWGTGSYGKKVESLLAIFSSKKILFTDSKVNNSNEHKGIITLNMLNPEKHFVLIGSSYIDEIKNELKKLNFSASDFFVFNLKL